MKYCLFQETGDLEPIPLTNVKNVEEAWELVLISINNSNPPLTSYKQLVRKDDMKPTDKYAIFEIHTPAKNEIAWICISDIHYYYIFGGSLLQWQKYHDEQFQKLVDSGGKNKTVIRN